MGSQSDYRVMKDCEKILQILKIKFETKIISAHRTPNRMFDFAKSAKKKILHLLLQEPVALLICQE